MKKLIFSQFLLIGGLICSCNNYEMEDYISLSNNVEDSQREEYTLHVLYDGNEYFVPCVLHNDKDSIEFLDKGFEYIYKNEISQNPDIICLIKGTNFIEYIEKSSINNCTRSDDYTPRPPKPRTTYLQIYEDIKYGGTSYQIDLNTASNNAKLWECPRLTDFHNFNDKISSLKIFDSEWKTSLGDYDISFTGYEHVNFQGAVLAFTFRHSINYLHEYHYPIDGICLETHNLKRIPKKNWW